MTRNIKLTLEYDGTDFFGFQLQPKHPTIQETLETALSKFFDQPMKIKSASGRTDAGVHARAQIVNFLTRHPAPVSQIQKGLNAHLPPSIVVKEVKEAGANFHARFSAKGKTYEYCVWNHPVRSPFWLRYSYHAFSPLNLTLMRRAAKYFVGRHDFRSFCGTDPKKKQKDTRRTVKKFLILREGSLLRFRVTANGFLYHMVRNMVGTLLEVGRGKLAPEAIPSILKSRDRRSAAATAPAKGLFLIDVTY